MSLDAERLSQILSTMEVPANRKQDWNWLRRNLGINNQDHPDLSEAQAICSALITSFLRPEAPSTERELNVT